MTEVRNILAVVSNASNGKSCLQTALSLGQQLKSQVEVLHVRSDPRVSIPLSGEAVTATMVDQMVEFSENESDSRAYLVRDMFKTFADGLPILKNTDSSSDKPKNFCLRWMEELGVEDQLVAMKVCRADFVVLSRPTKNDEASSLITFKSVLMNGGRPVIIAPPIYDGQEKYEFKEISKVGFFWNGSAESTRALQSALPLLNSVSKVCVLRIKENDWFADIKDIEIYLKHHNIEAEFLSILEGNNGGDVLLSIAREISVDMMIMGAYSRSKLRQIMAGSITDHFLRKTDLPIFFSS